MPDCRPPSIRNRATAGPRRTDPGAIARDRRVASLASDPQPAKNDGVSWNIAGDPPTKYLRQEALVGLGHAEGAGRRRRGALDAYTQAGALGGPYRTGALLATGRLQAASGHAGEARAVYESLLKTAADEETKALLTQKLGALRAPQAGAK